MDRRELGCSLGQRRLGQKDSSIQLERAVRQLRHLDVRSRRVRQHRLGQREEHRLRVCIGLVGRIGEDAREGGAQTFEPMRHPGWYRWLAHRADQILILLVELLEYLLLLQGLVAAILLRDGPLEKVGDLARGKFEEVAAPEVRNLGTWEERRLHDTSPK